MDDDKTAVARACLEGVETNTMTFPQIVGRLAAEGFESYTVDFRRAVATYYLPDGDSVALPMHRVDVAVAPSFDRARIQAAIREAQELVPGYTYVGFCKEAASAGCAAYMVSFAGRQALYIGRTGETHVEHFPGS